MEYFLLDLKYFKNTPVLLLGIVFKYIILISREFWGRGYRRNIFKNQIWAKFRACLQGKGYPFNWVTLALTHFLFFSSPCLQAVKVTRVGGLCYLRARLAG